jgi:hypothetical protein
MHIRVRHWSLQIVRFLAIERFNVHGIVIGVIRTAVGPCLGLGRSFIADPKSPGRLLSGQIDKLPELDIAMSANVALNAFAVLRWNTMQIEQLADGLDPDPSLTGDAAIAAFFELESRNTTALLEHRVVVAALSTIAGA